MMEQARKDIDSSVKFWSEIFLNREILPSFTLSQKKLVAKMFATQIRLHGLCSKNQRDISSTSRMHLQTLEKLEIEKNLSSVVFLKKVADDSRLSSTATGLREDDLSRTQLHLGFLNKAVIHPKDINRSAYSVSCLSNKFPRKPEKFIKNSFHADRTKKPTATKLISI